MQTKVYPALVVAAIFLIIGSLAFYRFARPIVCIHAFRAFPDFAAVGVLPLTQSEQKTLEQLIAETRNRRDSQSGRRLLDSIHSEFKRIGIEIRKTEAGIYCARCPKGPALVYHLDEEAYGYFVFVNINGPIDVVLDLPENGFDVLRSELPSP